MKILWVDVVSELGGAQRSLLDVSKKLILEPDIELEAAVPNGPLAASLAEAGIPVHPVSPVRATRRRTGFFSTIYKLLFATNEFSRILKVVKPDIVHANALPSFLATGLSGRKLPVFWHVRDLRQPVPLMREASHNATRIIAPSEAVAEYLAESLSRSIYSSIRTIPNGIDTEDFQPRDAEETRAKFGFPRSVPIVGMIAHFIKWKNHTAFLDMAAILKKSYPDAYFVIVGRDLFHEAGGYIRKLKERAQKLGMENSIRFIEDCDNVPGILPAFSVLVHPAVGEPFGRVVCEALSCEIPVVAIDSGGPGEIVEDGRTGILCAHDDENELAAGVSRLLNDEALRKRLGHAGRASIIDRYSINRTAKEIANLYRKTLNDLSDDIRRSRFKD